MPPRKSRLVTPKLRTVRNAPQLRNHETKYAAALEQILSSLWNAVEQHVIPIIPDPLLVDYAQSIGFIADHADPQWRCAEVFFDGTPYALGFERGEHAHVGRWHDQYIVFNGTQDRRVSEYQVRSFLHVLEDQYHYDAQVQREYESLRERIQEAPDGLLLPLVDVVELPNPGIIQAYSDMPIIVAKQAPSDPQPGWASDWNWWKLRNGQWICPNYWEEQVARVVVAQGNEQYINETRQHENHERGVTLKLVQDNEPQATDRQRQAYCIIWQGLGHFLTVRQVNNQSEVQYTSRLNGQYRAMGLKHIFSESDKARADVEQGESPGAATMGTPGGKRHVKSPGIKGGHIKGYDKQGEPIYGEKGAPADQGPAQAMEEQHTQAVSQAQKQAKKGVQAAQKTKPAPTSPQPLQTPTLASPTLVKPTLHTPTNTPITTQGPEGFAKAQDVAIEVQKYLQQHKPDFMGPGEQDEPMQCHAACSVIENAANSFPFHKDLQFVKWDESKWKQFSDAMNDPDTDLELPNIADEHVKNLIGDIADGSVNGHSFMKYGDYYIDPYLSSLGVPWESIQQADRWFEKTYTKLGISQAQPPKPKVEAPKPGLELHGDPETITAQKLSGPLGSNPGGIYMGKDGIKRYVKTYKEHLQGYSEAITNNIYRKLGLAAPISQVFADKEGNPGVAAPLIDNKGTVGTLGLDPHIAHAFAQGTAADMWLANWDAMGLNHDNVVIDKQDNPVRIDQGGALLYRAQGGKKSASDLKDITEWKTFFDPSVNPAYAKTMKAAGIDGPQDMIGYLQQGNNRIQALRKQSNNFEDLVPASNNITDSQRNMLLQVLRNRADQMDVLVKAAGKDIGKPKPQTPEEEQAGQAQEEHESANPEQAVSAPEDFKGFGKENSLGWHVAQMFKKKQAAGGGDQSITIPEMMEASWNTAKDSGSKYILMGKLVAKGLVEKKGSQYFLVKKQGATPEQTEQEIAKVEAQPPTTVPSTGSPTQSPPEEQESEEEEMGQAAENKLNMAIGNYGGDILASPIDPPNELMGSMAGMQTWAALPPLLTGMGTPEMEAAWDEVVHGPYGQAYPDSPVGKAVAMWKEIANKAIVAKAGFGGVTEVTKNKPSEEQQGEELEKAAEVQEEQHPEEAIGGPEIKVAMEGEAAKVHPAFGKENTTGWHVAQMLMAQQVTGLSIGDMMAAPWNKAKDSGSKYILMGKLIAKGLVEKKGGQYFPTELAMQHDQPALAVPKKKKSAPITISPSEMVYLSDKQKALVPALLAADSKVDLYLNWDKLLDSGDWSPLQHKILQAVFDKIYKKVGEHVGAEFSGALNPAHSKVGKQPWDEGNKDKGWLPPLYTQEKPPISMQGGEAAKQVWAQLPTIPYAPSLDELAKVAKQAEHRFQEMMGEAEDNKGDTAPIQAAYDKWKSKWTNGMALQQKKLQSKPKSFGHDDAWLMLPYLGPGMTSSDLDNAKTQMEKVVATDKFQSIGTGWVQATTASWYAKLKEMKQQGGSKYKTTSSYKPQPQKVEATPEQIKTIHGAVTQSIDELAAGQIKQGAIGGVKGGHAKQALGEAYAEAIENYKAAVNAGQLGSNPQEVWNQWAAKWAAKYTEAQQSIPGAPSVNIHPPPVPGDKITAQGLELYQHGTGKKMYLVSSTLGTEADLKDLQAKEQSIAPEEEATLKKAADSWKPKPGMQKYIKAYTDGDYHSTVMAWVKQDTKSPEYKKGEMFVKAIEDAPKWTGPMYRGMTLSDADYQDLMKPAVDFKKGGPGIYTFKAMQSFSRSYSFATNWGGYGGDHRIVMHIVKSKTGRMIEGQSHYHSESEVMALPGSKYKVIDFKEVAHPYSTAITHIYLEEQDA